MGGYTLNGEENVMRLTDRSSSESLASSGMGIVCARSRVSSGPLVIGGNNPKLCTGAGAVTERILLLRLRGGGESWPVEDGGDAGRAVWMALRIVDVLFAEGPVFANGDDVRRRKFDSSEGEGDIGVSDP